MYLPTLPQRLKPIIWGGPHVSLILRDMGMIQTWNATSTIHFQTSNKTELQRLYDSRERAPLRLAHQ